MNLIRTSLIVGILAITSVGCGVHSANPIGQAETLFADNEMVGVWKLQTPDAEAATVYLHVGRNPSDSQSLRCVTVHHSGENVPPARNASITSTQIGDAKIANISFESGSNPRRYTFAKYVFKNEELHLFPMKSEPVSQAIETGEIMGHSNSLRYVLLSANQAELTEFVANSDPDELFGTSTRYIFRRVEPQLAINDR